MSLCGFWRELLIYKQWYMLSYYYDVCVGMPN